MRPIVWLLVCIICTISVSLAFTQYFRVFNPEQEGVIDRQSCINELTVTTRSNANRDPTNEEKAKCTGDYYPVSDETARGWSDSKRVAVNNAFTKAGVHFASSGKEVDFVLNYFKDKYKFDILAYPYDQSMNPFHKLVENMKKDPKIKSFQQYLAENNKIKREGYSGGTIKTVGCHNDNPNRMIKNLTGRVSIATSINDCADRAVANNSRVFGLQWNDGNTTECLIGDGTVNEIANATSGGATRMDCTQPWVPWQNNVFVLPPKPPVFTDQETYDGYAANISIQNKFNNIPIHDYPQLLEIKPQIDSELRALLFPPPKQTDPFTEGINVVASSENDKIKYVGVNDRERGGATTWTPINVSDQSTGAEAVNGCKNICSNNAACGAAVVQKRAGPWDCWTIPKASLTNRSSYKKINLQQATYYKTDNVTCEKGATCPYSEPFQENFQYGPPILNTDFMGNDLDYMKITDIGACKTKCDANPGCKGILYRRNDPYCWLKNKTPQGSGLSSLSGHDSYAVVSDPVVIKFNSTSWMQLSQVVFNDANGNKISYDKSSIKASPSLGGEDVIDKIYDGNASTRSHPNIYHSNASTAFVEITLPFMPAAVSIYNRADCCQDRMASCTLSVVTKDGVSSTMQLKQDNIQQYIISPEGKITVPDPKGYLTQSDTPIVQGGSNSSIVKSATGTMSPQEFNDAVSAINSGIQITDGLAKALEQLRANGVNIMSGFTTIEGLDGQVKIVSDYSVRMGVTTDENMARLTHTINQTYGRVVEPIRILAEFGVTYSTLSVSLQTLRQFGIMMYDSLDAYYTASKGTLKQIGISPSLTVINSMNNYGLNYAVVMNANFIPQMQGFGFNDKSEFAAILDAMVRFGINSENFGAFRTLTGMKNVNGLPEYVNVMGAFGINKNDADHEQIVQLAHVFRNDLPDATQEPSLTRTKHLLQFFNRADIHTITNYKSFIQYMSEKFFQYDHSAFHESLTKFGDFKNNTGDNVGKLRTHEIIHMVDKLNSCRAFNATNKVTFRQLIDSLTGHNMRLYVDHNPNGSYMKFDQDACSFMNNFGGTLTNFKPDSFTTQVLSMFKSKPEPFTNAYSIAKKFGISNPVQAVPTADNSAFLSEPDFYTKLNSFGITSVDKYDTLVKVFVAFGSTNANFCKVTEKLKVFGVPSDEYLIFVKTLTKIKVTYPYFEKFIDTIMDFGVRYKPNKDPTQNLYYRFLIYINAFDLTFTPPDANGSNTLYRFLAQMKSHGLAVGYQKGQYPCANLEQPPDAFFHAIKSFIILGYNFENFFPSDGASGVSAIDMLNKINKYDCQLLDFSTPDLFNIINPSSTIKLATNMGVKEDDTYLKYYSEIFVEMVKTKNRIIPNIVFSFMNDKKYENKASLTGADYKNIVVLMEEYINKTFMDGLNVKEDRKNEYETYNLTMNTLRLFPNFSAAFIKDVSTNPDNSYNANFTSEVQDVNPNKQRGCDHFMHIPQTTKQRKYCLK
jgi:hypothetical protein